MKEVLETIYFFYKLLNRIILEKIFKENIPMGFEMMGYFDFHI